LGVVFVKKKKEGEQRVIDQEGGTTPPLSFTSATCFSSSFQGVALAVVAVPLIKSIP